MFTALHARAFVQHASYLSACKEGKGGGKGGGVTCSDGRLGSCDPTFATVAAVKSVLTER